MFIYTYLIVSRKMYAIIEREKLQKWKVANSLVNELVFFILPLCSTRRCSWHDCPQIKNIRFPMEAGETFFCVNQAGHSWSAKERHKIRKEWLVSYPRENTSMSFAGARRYVRSFCEGSDQTAHLLLLRIYVH